MIGVHKGVCSLCTVYLTRHITAGKSGDKKGKTMKKLIVGLLAALSCGWALAAVNINTATAEELKTLPGIGPAKAAAIVEYRQANGGFKAVDDLKKVKGIGEGIFNRLKAEATVGAPAKAAPAKPAQPVAKK